MKYLQFLFFCLLSINLFGQEVRIEGKCVGKNNVPLENVLVKTKETLVQSTFTDSLGYYFFLINNFNTLELEYSIGEFKETRKYELSLLLKFEKTIQIETIHFPILQQVGVSIIKSKIDPFEIEKMPTIDAQKITGSVERTLALTTAATSNNELTTNYNVRGGNYDENLVYVNGFQVFRPFLTRSGQQEGMSFIHSALVEDIRFSAGGFDAQYGDKLSSVLDITYKTPEKFKTSGLLSLLGVESHVEQEVNQRFNYLVGARYRSNGYFLNSLPTKGAYNPVFMDAQFLCNYNINENLIFSLLGHYSSNNFRFTPQTSETDFGTANEAYSFRIYFDGQEQTRFQTMMAGASLKWQASPKTKLDFYTSIFNSDEREYFDIQGQYYINLLETDPSQEAYGDSIAVLGIGTFLNHARNRLNATILSVYHSGEHKFFAGFKNNERSKYVSKTLKWGTQIQKDVFNDVLSEWKMVDSAGYSLPQTNQSELELFETIKGKLQLQTYRITGFAQFNTTWSTIKKNQLVEISKKVKVNGSKEKKVFSETNRETSSKFALALGIRAGYTSINEELFFTPRISCTFFPNAYMVKNSKIAKRNISFRFATGLYYQPPFYREFRTFDGKLNLNVKSQKSLHFVAGTDVFFNMWGREVPFKLTSEVFYKYLWDVNPYEIDNVRTRYFAENNAVAYAYGIDANFHGEFVEGIETFFKLGLLSTKEDIKNDWYKEYYNTAGERIIFGYSEDQKVVDSATIYPGYVPRPTDQFFTFGTLVQDQMPGFENFSVQMGMQFGSRLPYGPPDHSRYKDTLRMKSYFRVDLGMSYALIAKKPRKTTFWTKNFSEAVISFEIFNLLGINNVLSKQWIQDVEGKYYSIPNYLTSRRYNLKFIVRL